MAESITSRGSAMSLMEDAVHLLRAAPFATLAWHWAGSLPMAVGATYFWTEITHPGIAGPRLTTDALLMALLLSWLNVCRAVYASRLHDQLAGIPARQAGATILWRMAPVQSLLSASKLVVLPLAFLSTILLAPAVAFYRNATALVARQPEPGLLVAQARRYAGFQAAQNWRALGLLSCLYPAVLINMVLALAILPQMARILTGYESVYSRLGPRLLQDQLFWTFAFSATWLVLDPYVQAVYCLRCFQGESAETGEDVKAVMRRLRGPGIAALVLLTVTTTTALHAQSAPQPDLQRAIEQAAQSPEYDWRTPPQITQKQQPSWFVAATDRIVAASRAFLRSLADGIERLLRWIFGRPDTPGLRGAKPPTATLPIGVWVLIVLVLGAAGFAFLRARFPGRRKAASMSAAMTVATSEDAETMDPLRFPEQIWIELAERALAEQDWRLAMRAFYLASLGWLGRRELLVIHSGKTNREYELELRRRTRTVPQIHDLFAHNVAAFERAWYGNHRIGGEDVERFRDYIRQMQRQLETPL